jgi:hypothetical protein
LKKLGRNPISAKLFGRFFPNPHKVVILSEAPHRLIT